MATRFWVGGTGTWDASDTTHWAATSGGAGGQSVPGAADTVTFDANSGGGTVTVNHASNTILSVAMGNFTGTLDFATNDNNITMGSFANTGTGTRTLNMGDGTWTITGATGALWSQATITNLTFNANGSLLLFECTPTGQRGYDFGAVTFNDVHINNLTVTAHEHTLSNAGSFTVAGDLTLTNVRVLRMMSSTTITVTGTFTWDNSSTSFGVMHTNGPAVTISVASANVWTYCLLGLITKSGAGSITADNSYSMGNLTNITVNNPSGGGSGGGMRSAGRGGLAA